MLLLCIPKEEYAQRKCCHHEETTCMQFYILHGTWYYGKLPTGYKIISLENPFALYVYGILSLRCSPINQHAEISAIFSIFRTNHWGGNIRKIIFLTIFIHCKVLYRVILGALQNTSIKKCLHNNFNACINIFKWMCAQYRSQTVKNLDDAFPVTAIWIDWVQKSFVEFWAIGQVFASILPQILTLLLNSRIEKAMNFSMLYQI